MILFFDTETTGLPKNWKAPVTDLNNWPRMVQLAYIFHDLNGNVISQGDYIIKPEGYAIPKDASAIHGITTEKAMSEGKNLSFVLEEFNSFLNKAEYLVAHNISFDEKIVGAEFLRNKMQNPIPSKIKICTMESSTNYCAIDGPYGYKWPKLSELHYKLFRSNVEEAHNAAVDIDVTAKCFWELVKRKAIVLSMISANNIQESKNVKTETQLVKYDLSHNMNVSHFLNESILLKHEKKPYLDMDVNELVMELNSLKKDKQPISEEICYWNDAWLVEDEDGQMHCVEEYEWHSYLALNLQCKINDIIRLLKDHGITEESHPDLFGVEQQQLGTNNTVRQIDSSTLIPYRQGNKWGFCTNNKSIVIDCIYDQVKRFKNDLAAVKLDGRWGFIDASGETIIPFEFEEAISFNDENTAVVKYMGHAYYLNKNKELKLVELKPGYSLHFEHFSQDNYYQEYAYESGDILVTNFVGNGCIRRYMDLDTGEWESDSQFNMRCYEKNGMKPFMENGKIGFISSDKSTIIPARYNAVYNFCDGLAYVHWGFINKKGIEYWED